MVSRSAHCPACGLQVAEAQANPAATCPRCGAPIPRDDASRPPQRTIMGGTMPIPPAVRQAAQQAAQQAGAAPPQRTLMGMAAPFLPGGTGGPGAAPAGEHDGGLTRTQLLGTPRHAAAGYDPLTDPDRAISTVVDVPVFAQVAGVPPPPSGAVPQQRTLMGVARPGIAPLNPGVAKPIEAHVEDPTPPGYAPLEELGATMRLSPELQRRAMASVEEVRKQGPPNARHPLGQRRFDKVPAKEIRKQAAKQAARSRRALYVILAAVGIALTAVVVALLWPSAPPLRAQVRAGDGGTEVLDVECSGCPDGTVLKLREGEGKVQSGKASIPLPAPLAIGDTVLKVDIDRPESGRDESVNLPVRVAYRIRPELGSLDADKPSIQIVVDAMPGSKVTLDGEEVPLRDGRAAKSIDVSKDLLGPNSDPAAQLSRKVSFTVTPPDTQEEKGAVAVTAPILPLALDAPGRAVVTDKPTFVLAGRTLPGAEIVVSGRSIGITKDGAFLQTMNVSMNGETQIEVRARMPGRAPRLLRLDVKRVTSLETAAEEAMKKSPLGYDALAADLQGAIGKAVAVEGEVVEAKVQGPATVVLLQASTPACKAAKCLVRLVQGRADLAVSRGSRLRAFGVAVGTIAHEGANVPDVDVAFSISSDKGAPPPAGAGPP
ncbi:MAG: hypothetical protein HOV80_20135 [Polyangiaceae bacterium]|nr:hypothetical protein [Polyangiaceae bacterium]